MFSYTGLTPVEIVDLRERFHIYLISSGRMSIAGCKFFFSTSAIPVMDELRNVLR